MQQTIKIGTDTYGWSFKEYHSIAIPFLTNDKHVNAWYVPPIEKKAFTAGDFVGSVEAGASVNFFDIKLNPHGNGTHTECLGHITLENESLKDVQIDPFLSAQLISVQPDNMEGDYVITKAHLSLLNSKVDALIIRTLPNSDDKISKQYTGSNPAYLTEEAALFIHDSGIKHILIDTPSVDKEDDGGKLLAHKAFWGFHSKKRHSSTITEMIYVPTEIKDGLFLLNLQFLPIENDASPSNPIIFPLTNIS